MVLASFDNMLKIETLSSIWLSLNLYDVCPQ